jgi:hypothetical protein
MLLIFVTLAARASVAVVAGRMNEFPTELLLHDGPVGVPLTSATARFSG